MKIGYFGIEGSYTYFAARKHFGVDAVLEGRKTFREVFECVERGDCAYGVVPIENSLAGSVGENYDNLLRYEVRIVGEEYVGIEHCLLGIRASQGSDSQLSAIRKVYGHPQSLAQCSGFFVDHPEMEQVAWGDNASAAKFVAEQNDESLAAIASRETGDLYGLEVLAEGIADEKVNITRFIIVGQKSEITSRKLNSNIKISLYFTVRHEVGSLVRVLEELAGCGVNLTKIESRPIKGTRFEYGFFVDGVMENADALSLDSNYSVNDLQLLGIYLGL